MLLIDVLGDERWCQVWLRQRQFPDSISGTCSGGGDFRIAEAVAPDTLIMATARCHGLTVVTRNVEDFVSYPQIFNPWER